MEGDGGLRAERDAGRPADLKTDIDKERKNTPRHTHTPETLPGVAYMEPQN